MAPKLMTSIPAFIATVGDDYAKWNTEQYPWFRGEPGETETPLLPKVYRPKRNGGRHDENALLQFFRIKAPILNLPLLPQRDETDKWLFLARHVGLPTRLLDWTEGALIALYFALLEKEPVVWMLNPLALNRESAADVVPNAPSLTWHRPSKGPVNIYEVNIRDAWELGGVEEAMRLPVAIHPTHIHPLMSAQHSCFTVHGKDKKSLNRLVGENCLRRYKIGMDKEKALGELRMLGVSYSTLFPDPQGLARELDELF